MEVGKEWLGEDHPAVASLKAGVAIHHGGLPSPFLRELELLLSEGVLKVIVASPTLSQGLNLNAAVLLMPTLYRAGEMIKGEEFANVAGRAGRAFVDVEGLIVHVMFDKIQRRKKEWRKLVVSAKARTLKSGLIQIVAEILQRLSQEGVLDRDDAWEYLANAREAWESPGEEPLSQLVERLDATVFGLIEALDADRADLPRLLGEALKGSLWARQIAHEDKEVAPWHKKVLEARANLIWETTTAQARRGHFAMGVGLEAGLIIDAMADELADLLDRADEAALTGDVDELFEVLVGLSERLLFVRPFIPDKANALPANWKVILRRWVSGEEVSKIGPQNMRAIEEAFTYRLVWALEAVRTRRISLGWAPETVVGGAVATVETGVPQFMMAMLIRAGLPSRARPWRRSRTRSPPSLRPPRCAPGSNPTRSLPIPTQATGLHPTPQHCGRASELELSAAASKNGRLNTASACSTSRYPRPQVSIELSSTRVMDGPGWQPQTTNESPPSRRPQWIPNPAFFLVDCREIAS